MSILWVIVITIVFFSLGAILGAPYLPSRRQDVDNLLGLAGAGPGKTIIDLGSGDGRLLLAAAKRGSNAIGYEINPLLYLISLVHTRPYRKQITVRLGNYWHTKLPAADAVVVFLIGRYMRRLDRKLTAELEQPTLLVSYVFAIPGRKPVKTTKNCFVYSYPGSKK